LADKGAGRVPDLALLVEQAVVNESGTKGAADRVPEPRVHPDVDSVHQFRPGPSPAGGAGALWSNGGSSTGPLIWRLGPPGDWSPNVASSVSVGFAPIDSVADAVANRRPVRIVVTPISHSPAGAGGR
jgi:hypothetical protein